MPVCMNREQVVAMVSHSADGGTGVPGAAADDSGSGSPVPALCGVRVFRTREVSPCALASTHARR